MIKDTVHTRTASNALLQKTDFLILRFLHFADNKEKLYRTEYENYDRLWKMRLIIAMIVYNDNYKCNGGRTRADDFCMDNFLS
jgi:hypothetical protein